MKREALFDLLTQLGVQTVTTQYEGSNDEGMVGGMQLLPDVVNASTYEVKGATVDSLYVKGAYRQVEVDGTLWDALGQLCYEVLDETGHQGWEINDGGYGELTVNVADRTVVLSHTDYYTSERTSDPVTIKVKESK